MWFWGRWHYPFLETKGCVSLIINCILAIMYIVMTVIILALVVIILLVFAVILSPVLLFLI